MILADLLFAFRWWAMLFTIGILFFPITSFLFSSFPDKGYAFSKILGIIALAYPIFVLGTLRIFPFSSISLFLFVMFSLLLALCINGFFLREAWIHKKLNVLFLVEEFLFAVSLLVWTYIRGFQPDINGLEKFMDYGFINSILRSDTFPPKDMWFTPLSINYYYFGHLVSAVLTKLSAIPSEITYNLMIATIFAFSISLSFSIGYALWNSFAKKPFGPYACGILAFLLVAFSGNLHPIFSLFSPYPSDKPAPFWELAFSPFTFPNSYWYPNATRFIYNTIHEFPIYSFVVSDLHGHVLGIPLVLTTIAFLLNAVLKGSIQFREGLVLSFLIALSYMTNAWDAPIYFFITILVFLYLSKENLKSKTLLSFTIKKLFPFSAFLILGAFILSLPFSLFFEPFASRIGVLCPPSFLVNLKHIGPFVFEPNHCQKSPLWQLGILYGFFFFWFFSFIVLLLKQKRGFRQSDVFVFLLESTALLLIAIPEFFYAKDIYPAHYRANTMFKLSYQAFIMFSLSSAYIAVRFISRVQIKNKMFNSYHVFLLCAFLLLILVMSYPIFAISGYYSFPSGYKGLNGILYLKDRYPADYGAILWLKNAIKGQPVILEAQGDSYTDFARVSSNTGIPTVLGWTVHEWLWRKTYDVPAPRISHVKTLYESNSLQEVKRLIQAYQISYIFIGELEKQKYRVTQDTFDQLGTVVYRNNQTTIYRVN